VTNPAVFFTLLALALGLGGTAIVAVFDLIEKTTSKQGYPPSVFRRRKP